jgi:hypothetical protein
VSGIQLDRHFMTVTMKFASSLWNPEVLPDVDGVSCGGDENKERIESQESVYDESDIESFSGSILPSPVRHATGSGAPSITPQAFGKDRNGNAKGGGAVSDNVFDS